MFCEFSAYRLRLFLLHKMSSHQTSAKLRSSKCGHFCFLFDTTIIAPHAGNLARETTSVTNQSPCNICASFSEEQQIKIKHRRWYVRKLARKVIWTYWVTMWRRFLALKQTLRVLQKIDFLHLPIPNPYVSNLYH